jgi:hypothetical protein
MPGTYPPDWPAIAEGIKRAAGYRCEACGHPHEPATGYTLTVHHLDGNKSNCHWTNLVAMCQRCHLHWQGIWQPGQPWLFGAPQWALRRGLAGERGVVMSDLTPCDHELLAAIHSSADADGAARSLFEVAVRRAGIDYKHARYRLSVLAALGYVTVKRHGRTDPLIMRCTE